MKFKWQSFCQKWFFSVANFFMHMFDVSLMTLQSIRICQQVLRVKVISPCMHYLSCTTSEHTKPHSQELPKMDQWKKAVVSTKICFSASYFFKHMFSMYVMRLQNIRLLQEILWDELISLFMYYCHAKANFQEDQRELTINEWIPTHLFYLTTTSHQYQHLCKIWNDSLNYLSR